MAYFLYAFFLSVTSIFLILVVLVQRGRGGGLSGALGGLGGQSAFGAKAGDVFTRITIGVAAFWIFLCILSVKFLGSDSDAKLSPDFGSGAESPSGAVVAPPEPSPGGEKEKAEKE